MIATHRHKTRGTEYVLLDIGKMQTDRWCDYMESTERRQMEWIGVDMQEVVIYCNAADPTEVWVRPRKEFEDGRFEVL